MAQPTVQNDHRVKVVPFSSIIRGVSEGIREELQELVDDLPTQSEDSRYDRTSLFVSKSRKKLLQLMVMLKWLEGDGGRRHKSLMNISDLFVTLRNRHAYLDKIQDDLYAFHRNLYSNRSRRLVIEPAIDILTSETYRYLPQSIATLGEEVKVDLISLDIMLPRLDYLLKMRLFCIDTAITNKFDDIYLSNGTLHLQKNKQYSLAVTLRNFSVDSSWRVVGFSLLLSAPPQGNVSVMTASPSQTLSAIELMNSNASLKSDDSLSNIISIADSICLYIVIATLKMQARSIKKSGIGMEVHVESRDRNKMNCFYFLSSSSLNLKSSAKLTIISSTITMLRLLTLETTSINALESCIFRRAALTSSMQSIDADLENCNLFRLDASVTANGLRIVVMPTLCGILHGISVADDLRSNMSDCESIEFGIPWPSSVIASCLFNGISLTAIMLLAKESTYKRKLSHLALRLEASVHLQHCLTGLGLQYRYNALNLCIQLVHFNDCDLIEISMDSLTSAFVVITTCKVLTKFPKLFEFEAVLNLPSTSNDGYTRNEVDPLIFCLKLMCLSSVVNCNCIQTSIESFSSAVIGQMQHFKWDRSKAKHALFDDEQCEDKHLIGCAVLVNEQIGDYMDADRLSSIKSYLIRPFYDDDLSLSSFPPSMSVIQSSALVRFGLSLWNVIAIMDDFAVKVFNWIGWKSHDSWMKFPLIFSSCRVNHYSSIQEVPSFPLSINHHAFIDLFNRIACACSPAIYDSISISADDARFVARLDDGIASIDTSGHWKKLQRTHCYRYNLIYRQYYDKIDCLIADADHLPLDEDIDGIKSHMTNVTGKCNELDRTVHVDYFVSVSQIGFNNPIEIYATFYSSSLFKVLCEMSLRAALIDSFYLVRSVLLTCSRSSSSSSCLSILDDASPFAMFVRFTGIRNEIASGTVIPCLNSSKSVLNINNDDLFVCNWVQTSVSQKPIKKWSDTVISNEIVRLFTMCRQSNNGRVDIDQFKVALDNFVHRKLNILSLISDLGSYLIDSYSAVFDCVSQMSPVAVLSIPFGSSGQQELIVTFTVAVDDSKPSIHFRLVNNPAMIETISEIFMSRLLKTSLQVPDSERKKLLQFVTSSISNSVSSLVITASAFDSTMANFALSVNNMPLQSQPICFYSSDGSNHEVVFNSAIINVITCFIGHIQSITRSQLMERQAANNARKGK